MLKNIKTIDISKIQFFSSIEECEECGEPLDDKHQMRDVFCEDCGESLGYETCAEDFCADYCEKCR